MDLINRPNTHLISILLEFSQDIITFLLHQAIMIWASSFQDVSNSVWEVIHHLQLDQLPCVEVPLVVVHLRKSEAIEKMAEAISEHAKAIAEQTAAKKEKAKADKIDKYLKLMTIDISTFSDEQKARHERVLNRLTKELFPEDDL
ncbi:hypothetical protein HU200_014850 [Digitaria exilis]|uniref:Uncharacterized protein n=1 Tax=Digitaria exilis TaxID=1010633 RepID=A0A835KMH5_9POAL|nr:hypothetical protein HU200_014850 [Digitaria exilis]